jgi:8-amino-7-oxononanoate synthase
MAAGVRAALRLSAEAPERREALAHRIARFGDALRAECDLSPTPTQIQPIIVKTDSRATGIATALQQQGYDVRAVRPPTVPEGTARLRVSLTLNAGPDDITSLVSAIARELERTPA